MATRPNEAEEPHEACTPKMFQQHIGHKILLVVGIVTSTALFLTGWFYSNYQEQSIYEQNRRTMEQLIESVLQGIQTIMLVGYADVAQIYADHLKEVKDITDFRVLRTDGLEAFRDNNTINNVNERRGEELFIPRDEESHQPVMLANNPELLRVLRTTQLVSYEEILSSGEHYLTFLAPIINGTRCTKCHGTDHDIRGVLKFTTSLKPIEDAVAETRRIAFIIMSVALALIIAIVSFVLTRTVIRPIGKVTHAMNLAATGDLSDQVPVFGNDELGRMAGSFNVMTSELQRTYQGLQDEQDKLTTIIQGAREGIVVTDGEHHVVLVNRAAELLLGKSHQHIITEGFLNIIDQPQLVMKWLQSEGSEPEVISYNSLTLSIYAETIHAASGKVVGSAALIRDITEEKRLEEELRRLSSTDALTSLYNRRYLDLTIAAELDRSQRYSLPLSIMMFDVDHFKKFNDTHGHDQGDRVLIAIGAAMRACMRNIDSPCRYGGEEFIGILPETGPEGAMVVAERLRQYIEAMEVDTLKVTISIGVASVPHLDINTGPQLVETADAALYRAKDGGRNCVVQALPTPTADP